MRRFLVLLLLLVAFVSISFCGRRICKKPSLPSNAIIKYKKTGPGKVLIPGSKILIKCKKGFKLFGHWRIKCGGNGKWTKKPPVCVDANILCPMIAPIVNGTAKTSRKVLSHAKYRCNEGYKILGLQKRKCLPSGNWTGEAPTCIKKRCKRPQMLSHFKHGHFKTESSSFEVGSTITFFCKEDYYMTREDAMTCMENEEWKPRSVPKCYSINCGDPGRPNNGRRYGSNFTVGETVKYFCNYGYSLLGSGTRTCRSDFTWSGELAVCSSTTRKSDCPDPGIPAKGGRSGDKFNRGDQLKFYCQSGYTLGGSAVRRCKGNGTWTGLPAVCEDESKVFIPPLNETTKLFERNFVDKLLPETCSSNSNGKCNYPKYRGRSIDLNHPNGLELIFLFDSSSSIGQKPFRKALEFACHLIERLGVDYGIGGTRIAAITFSTRATLAYNLGDEEVNTVAKACKVTTEIRYSGGGTGTRLGLSLAEKLVKPLFRESSNRALILIADGKSNFGGSPESTAKRLRQNASVEIFAIGVGKKVYTSELRIIASKGKGHVFKIDKYDNFRTMSELMIKRDYSKCGEGGIASTGRILGGEESTSTYGAQWPWQVAVYRFNGSYHKAVCGGSLIRNNIVVTAAHCLMNAARNKVVETTNGYRIVAGELKLLGASEANETSEIWLDEKGLRVKKIYVHQKYKPGNVYEDDIALLELETPVEWNGRVRPVCLPKGDQNVEAKVYGFVSGWGNTQNIAKGQVVKKTDKLRYVSLPVQSNQTCDLLDSRKNKMFCAGAGDGEKDSCGGDSGGPFVVKLADDEEETKFSFYLMGIVSHGPTCGTKDAYGYYTRVTNYLKWIERTQRCKGVEKCI